MVDLVLLAIIVIFTIRALRGYAAIMADGAGVREFFGPRLFEAAERLVADPRLTEENAARIYARIENVNNPLNFRSVSNFILKGRPVDRAALIASPKLDDHQQLICEFYFYWILCVTCQRPLAGNALRRKLLTMINPVTHAEAPWIVARADQWLAAHHA